MNIKKHLILLGLLISSIFTSMYAKSNDIYIIYYATYNGKTGHIGIAVDNYKIRIIDSYNKKGERTSKQKTIKTGKLTYYDLWPKVDDFSIANITKDTPAKYYKLPTASWEEPITVNSLLEKGIPNEEGYPVDGLLKIKTTAVKDAQLKNIIQKIINENQTFNAIHFNCTDFVELILKFILNKPINSKENILLFKVSTPNKLYTELLKIPEIIPIREAKNKAKGTFLVERILTMKQ